VICLEPETLSGPFQNRDQLLAAVGSDALGGAEEVTLDRTDRHGQSICDFLVRKPLRGKRYDFALTGSERLRRRRRP
jgi:hypothetical protein